MVSQIRGDASELYVASGSSDSPKSTPSTMGTVRCAVGLGVISGSILLLEISSTRLLSFVSWHHFAFMVVSVAMLGLGAASVTLAVSRRLQERSLGVVSAVSCLLFAAFTLVGYLVVTRAAFSPPQLATNTGEQLLRLALTSVGLLAPFFAGGVAIAACLSRRAAQAATLYGGDLIGAGVGALAGVLIAGPLSVEQGVLVAGVFGAVGAMIFGWPRRRLLAIAAALAVVLSVICWVAPWFVPATPAAGKAMQLLLAEAPNGQILATRNTPLGRVDLIEAGRPVLWSLNPRAPLKAPPPQLHLLIDAEADTPVTLLEERDIEDLDYLDYLPSSFVFALARPERALILGAGGGQDVLSALRHDTREVDAVEINPATVELMGGMLLDRTGGLYKRRGVRLIRAEGRSFVRAAKGRYDVVQMGLVDTWAATSTGGLSLTENFLYTTDAFSDYLTALRSGGMISVTRWLHRPPRETLRLTGLAIGALKNQGVEDPSAHIVVVGVGRVGALLVSREPLDEDDTRRVASLARQRRLDVHYLPHRISPEGERNAFEDLLAAEDFEDFVATYSYDISPASDDRPFFFDFNTPRGWWALTLLTDFRNAALSGTATLAAVLIQSLLLSLVLLFGPVVARKVEVGSGGWLLVAYFGLTGTGFMFIEVPLLQRLTLVVGHPAQAAALVLCVLLGSSGFASLASDRITGTSPRRIALSLAILCVVGLLMAVFGDELGRTFLGAPSWLRPVLAGVSIVPVGLLMGLATPHGLRVAAKGSPKLVPMLWATTSFASVVGSVLSVMVSMHAGFGTALGVGAMCYLLGGLTLLKFKV